MRVHIYDIVRGRLLPHQGGFGKEGSARTLARARVGKHTHKTHYYKDGLAGLSSVSRRLSLTHSVLQTVKTQYYRDRLEDSPSVSR